MRFKVYRQFPRCASKKFESGELSLLFDTTEHTPLAMLSTGTRVIFLLCDACVKSISVNGLMIIGKEELAPDKQGTRRFQYQEWWCIPLEMEV